MSRLDEIKKSINSIHIDQPTAEDHVRELLGIVDALAELVRDCASTLAEDGLSATAERIEERLDALLKGE